LVGSVKSFGRLKACGKVGLRMMTNEKVKISELNFFPLQQKLFLYKKKFFLEEKKFTRKNKGKKLWSQGEKICKKKL
jgi:hypothetical protein